MSASLIIGGQVIPVTKDVEHEYVLSSELVAKGYGVDAATLRKHKQNHSSELFEGKHFLSVTNIHAGNGNLKKTFWTKRGIVRLGFFIRSERARLFRDMAEDLVIERLGGGDTAALREIGELTLRERSLRAEVAGLEAKLADVTGRLAARERPRSIGRATEQSVERFLSDSLLIRAGSSISTNELMAAYVAWARERDIVPLSAGKVAKLLPLPMLDFFGSAKSKSLKRHGRCVVGYRGVIWRDEAEAGLTVVNGGAS